MTDRSTKRSRPSTAPHWLEGGGEMGGRIRALDWSKTAIGPMDSWSPALRMMVRYLLVNPFPILLWWGPDYICIYNDAYIPVLGAKHPSALGQPVRETWSEIWHVLQPLIDTPFRGGPATWNEDIQLELNRHGFVEETHFTIAYSAVPDETVQGGIGGVIATVHEISDKVVAERRVVALRDLGARVGQAKTVDEACVEAAKALSAHAKDIPFVLLYLIDSDRRHARLACDTSADASPDFCPSTLDLQSDSLHAWPVAQTIQSGALQFVTPLQDRFTSVPQGPWIDAPNTAVVLPIPSNKAAEPAGVLIAGLSARLKFDQYYRDFLDLVRAQVAAAIARASAYDEERKRAEALAQIDRAKTAFFSNVSHEFRTPLALLVGPIEDALADSVSPLPPAQRERQEIAHRNALRLLRLVNTLLDFSRIEAGRSDASFEPTDLATLTTDLASAFRSAIEKAGLELVVQCDPLPEPVYVDRDKWEKIVLNLLSNAFKFTFEGRITVTLRAEGDHVTLAVADTGVGIPESDLPRMFERFHRVRDTRARTHEGTGIGLALVQELVRLHGGDVSVTSRVGQGTTFTISIRTGTAHLPSDRIVAPAAESATRIAAAAFVEEALRWLPDSGEADAMLMGDVAEPLPSASGTFQGRVLVADDNADMRDYLRRILGQSYRVETVRDGQAALERIRADRPDLVLADVMMPSLDGFGLLAAIRADDRLRSIPVVLLSARAGEEARIEGLRAGANEYLVKPFSARELLATLASQMELARMRRESERAYRYLAAIVDSAEDAILSKDLNGIIQSSNAAAERLFGYSAEELVGRPVRILIPPDRQDEEDDILLRLRRGERIEHFETVRVTKDGRYINIALTISPVRDETGTIIGASKIARDITSFKRAEVERLRLLRENAAVTETLNNVGALVASDLDRDKVVQAVTEAAKALTTAQVGAFDPAFEGTSVVRSADITQDVGYGRALPFDMPADHPPIRSYLAVPVKGRAGDVVGGLVFGHSAEDRFTEQHERLAKGVASWASVALENARMYMTVQEANRIKDDFLASLSHELRTPLNAILGYARMLRAGIVPPDKRDKAIDTIERNATSLTQIVEDVLDISRIVSGKIRLNVQPVELPEIVRGAVDAVALAAEAKGVRLEMVIDPEAAPVSGDPERLQQVLWNLLSNAVKFTDRGGRVQVQLARVNSHVEVTVSDTGIGIPPEFLPHMFERFRQADAGIARARGGLGLGLSIARQLTEMHGGTLTASSAGVGKGSTFRLTIPLMIVHPAQTDSAPRVHPRSGLAPRTLPIADLRDVHVLAVDDEPDALSLVSELLRAAGARVSTARSAEDALTSLETEVPDVLLADLGMPTLDGFQFIVRVRRHADRRVRDLPAAALTAYARTEDRMKALRAGFQIHLAKPVDPAELVTTIASLAKRFVPRLQDGGA
jgi:PAS domain S-box-containing protein